MQGLGFEVYESWMRWQAYSVAATVLWNMLPFTEARMHLVLRTMVKNSVFFTEFFSSCIMSICTEFHISFICICLVFLS